MAAVKLKAYFGIKAAERQLAGLKRGTAPRSGNIT